MLHRVGHRLGLSRVQILLTVVGNDGGEPRILCSDGLISGQLTCVQVQRAAERVERTGAAALGDYASPRCEWCFRAFYVF